MKTTTMAEVGIEIGIETTMVVIAIGMTIAGTGMAMIATTMAIATGMIAIGMIAMTETGIMTRIESD